MDNKCSATPRTVSVPSLIGWLSLCLLAAAWGRQLDERWCQIWTESGTFGLAAAVGLGSLEKTRQSRIKRKHDKALEIRFESGLDRVSQHSATIDSINAAVRRLAQQAAIDMHGKFGRSQRNRRRDQMEMVADYPLEITPIDEQAEQGIAFPSSPGVLQQISSRVISFDHYEPIPTRTVLLTFTVGPKRLTFVVDVTWTQKVDESYSSGGTVLAVGVPRSESDPEPAPEPVEV